MECSRVVTEVRAGRYVALDLRTLACEMVRTANLTHTTGFHRVALCLLDM